MTGSGRLRLMAATRPGFGSLKRRFDPDGVFASAIPLPEGKTLPVTLETHSL
jgi:hypothetical protein